MSRFDVSQFWPVPDDEFICGICMNVLDKPLETPCRHVFCSECIHKSLTEQKKCPLCRQRCMKSNLKEVLPLVQNLINKLKMKCCNLGNGCVDFIPTEHYFDHLEVCQYSMVQCPNEDCHQELLKRDLEEHETNLCSYREFLCNKGCGMSIPKNKVDSHVCIDALLLKVNELQEKNSELQKMLDDVKSKVPGDKDLSGSTHGNRTHYPESDYNSSDTDSSSSDTDTSSSSSPSDLWDSDSPISPSSPLNASDFSHTTDHHSISTSETDERLGEISSIDPPILRPSEIELNSWNPGIHQNVNAINDTDSSAANQTSVSVDVNLESSSNFQHVDVHPTQSSPQKEAACSNGLGSSPVKRPHDKDTNTQNKKGKQAKLATIYFRIDAGRSGVCSVRATASATDSLKKHDSTNTPKKHHVGHKKSKEVKLTPVEGCCSKDNETPTDNTEVPHSLMESGPTSGLDLEAHSSHDDNMEVVQIQDSETVSGHEDIVHCHVMSPLTRRSARLQGRQVPEENMRVALTGSKILSK